jgi:hypothetical protein
MSWATHTVPPIPCHASCHPHSTTHAVPPCTAPSYVLLCSHLQHNIFTHTQVDSALLPMDTACCHGYGRVWLLPIACLLQWLTEKSGSKTNLVGARSAADLLQRANPLNGHRHVLRRSVRACALSLLSLRLSHHVDAVPYHVDAARRNSSGVNHVFANVPTTTTFYSSKERYACLFIHFKSRLSATQNTSSGTSVERATKQRQPSRHAPQQTRSQAGGGMKPAASQLWPGTERAARVRQAIIGQIVIYLLKKSCLILAICLVRSKCGDLSSVSRHQMTAAPGLCGRYRYVRIRCI